MYAIQSSAFSFEILVTVNCCLLTSIEKCFGFLHCFLLRCEDTAFTCYVFVISKGVLCLREVGLLGLMPRIETSKFSVAQ